MLNSSVPAGAEQYRKPPETASPAEPRVPAPSADDGLSMDTPQSGARIPDARAHDGCMDGRDGARPNDA